MLELKNLTIAYGDTIAVKDVSFSVNTGEILALIGPNGVGKTSLIRAVSGIIPIKSGSIQFQGHDLMSLSIGERAKVLSVVPQVRQMGGAFTVKQAVMMGRTPHMSWAGHPGERDYRAVNLAIDQTNLKEFTDRQIASLSGGEQQRVLLARALAQSTPVMLLDEPTNHLDLQHQAILMDLVKTLSKSKNLAVLMAIHDLNLVSYFADRVALLFNGRLHHLGLPEDVMRENILREVYQIPIEVIRHPRTGSPIIFPSTGFPA
jgi:iron complex transport system ATP-binding protein